MPRWTFVRSRRRGVGMWETRSVFHISMPLLLRQDGLRCGWPVAQRRVRPLRVVFHAPPLRQNLCLLHLVKALRDSFVATMQLSTREPAANEQLTF